MERIEHHTDGADAVYDLQTGEPLELPVSREPLNPRLRDHRNADDMQHLSQPITAAHVSDPIAARYAADAAFTADGRGLVDGDDLIGPWADDAGNWIR